MSDPRDLYARAIAQTEKIVAAVPPERYGDPTPCTEYDVRRLIGHLAGGLNRAAHVGGGGVALEMPAHVRDVPDAGLPAAYAEAAERAKAAWADDAKLDEVFDVPWGKVPGRAVLAGYFQEVLTHGWDLAKATGQPTELASELAEAALGSVRQLVPAEHRGGPIPFGPVVEPPADAGPYARLAAWLGRTTR